MTPRIARVALSCAMLLFLAATRPATAQIAEDEGAVFLSQTTFGLGLQAGLLTGSGVSFRVHPAGRFGVQVVAGGITLSERFFSSIGIEGQYDFDSDGRSRFYGFVGCGYYSNGHEAPKLTENGQYEDEERLAAPFRLGVGAAYEISLSRKLVFTPSLGFTWFVRDGDFWPLPQLALHYYFN